MLHNVLITGASGNVGQEVIAALQQRGANLRIGSRLCNECVPGAERVRLDFHDRATYAPAVAGCGALFLLRPPAISNTRQTLNPLVDAARAAGVEQIVFLSVAGAGRNPLVPHHAVEQHLQRGPLDWTILRPGFFAQNIGTAYRADIVQANCLYLPAGQGRVAFVDLRDVGEVAARALLEKGHKGSAYTLTGPQPFSFSEVAALLSEATGRSISYEAASVSGYIRHLRGQGMGWTQALVQMVLHVGLRVGQAEGVDPTLEMLLARKPRSVADYIADNAMVWT